MFGTINRIINPINEGVWDTVKGAAGRAASTVKNKMSTIGKNITTKVTADKLQSAWKKAGSPTDSEEIKKIILAAGTDPDAVNQAYSSLKIPTQSSTGGQAATTSTGVRHTASATNPNQPPPTPSSTGGQTATTSTSVRHAASPTNPNQPQPTQSSTATPSAASPVDANALTKKWIQYLKNNQIVDMQADPTTGELKYKKPVTSDVLKTFLGRTGYTDDQINAAMATTSPASATSSTGGQTTATSTGVRHTASATNPNQPTPAKSPAARKSASKSSAGAAAFGQMTKQLGATQAPAQPAPTQPTSAPSSTGGQTTTTSTGVSHAASPTNPNRQQPAAAKPAAKTTRTRKPAVKEALVDNPGAKLSEDDIERIFTKLQTPAQDTEQVNEDKIMLARILKLAGLGDRR
jgi:hypothetical protein